MENNREDLLREALAVYGLDVEHILAWNVRDNGELVIVTKGGKKVAHRAGGAALLTLSDQDKTGDLPESEFIWDGKLNQRRPKDK